MSGKSNYCIQWATQFYVAAELCRRKYVVTFTLGNAPRTDLQVSSSLNGEFTVEVKGQSTHNFWLIKEDHDKSRKYYFLVYIPENHEKLVEFFIMTREEMMAERTKYQKHIEQSSGRYRDELGGFNWKTIYEKDKNGRFLYKDRWDKLPS